MANKKNNVIHAKFRRDEDSLPSSRERTEAIRKEIERIKQKTIARRAKYDSDKKN